jgi:type I restriction enzyme, R subunit
VFGQEFLDESLVVKNDAKDHRIPQTGKVWDLSKVDFDKLRKDFKASAHRNIKIAEMRAFIEKKLQVMLTRNRSRAAFAERLQEIIDEYNTGSSSTDRIFDELSRFMGDMSEEDERHTRLGPTEDELEIYDLLKKEKMTQSEEKKVRLAAKALMKRLLEEAPRVWCRIGSRTRRRALSCGMRSARCWTKPCWIPTTGICSRRSATACSSWC